MLAGNGQNDEYLTWTEGSPVTLAVPSLSCLVFVVQGDAKPRMQLRLEQQTNQILQFVERKHKCSKLTAALNYVANSDL